MFTGPTAGHAREYEYIVVGSGAGGGTVAARLAEAGHTVLVLEAGGDPFELQGTDAIHPDGNTLPEDYEVPAFHASATENSAMAWDFYVGHHADSALAERDVNYQKATDAQASAGVLYPRAGTLGGCTAHNAHIFLYPDNADWDHIARLTGDPSWSAERMRELFMRMERCRHRLRLLDPFNRSRHGRHGWLSTEVSTPAEVLREWQLVRAAITSAAIATIRSGALVDELRQLLRGRADPNDWQRVCGLEEGVFYTPLTTHRHARHGTRERLLAVRDRFPERLTIELDALATKVVIDDALRATGVQYLKGRALYRAFKHPSNESGEPREARASREVILAGGAFNTPQLLMLSGIGEARQLRRFDIPQRVDLPAVGRNLQDRYEVGLVYRMAREWDMLHGATFGRSDKQFRRWKRWRRGVYTSNGAVLGVIRRSSRRECVPDLFCGALLGGFRGYAPLWSKVQADQHDLLTWVVLKGHTRNRRGWVELRSGDPRVPPAIAFNYFDIRDDPAGEDLKAMIAGVRFVRETTDALVRSGVIVEEVWPATNPRSDEAIGEFVRANAWGHHASCTCPIGPRDQGGVVDSKLRVHGVRGLRIADASVFPRIPGLFIVSAVYMVGEKAADAILQDVPESTAAGDMPHSAASGATPDDASRVADAPAAAAFVGDGVAHLSWSETVRFHVFVTLMASLWGIVVPNRLFVPWLARFDAGRHAARLLHGLKRKYANRNVSVWFPFRRTLVAMNEETRRAVLDSQDNSADPALKRHTLGQFVPGGLIISRGAEWQRRRAFNEQALGFGQHLHAHADAFADIVNRSVAEPFVRPSTDLRWRDFHGLALRITQQVILGSGCIDAQAADAVMRMARWSNAYVLPRRRRLFARLYDRIAHHWQRLGSADASPATLGAQPLSRQCLVHDAIALTRNDSRYADDETRVPAQIGFWMFVLQDAIELHVPRTLALIAAHPAIQDRVRRDILDVRELDARAIDGLHLLEACIEEQLRLWTAVPILLRRVGSQPLLLPDGTFVPGGQQIMIHAAAFHRDPGEFGDAAHRFEPDTIASRSDRTLFFSSGRQSCAGQFVARFMLKAVLAALLRRSRYELVGPRIDSSNVPHTYDHFAIRLRPCDGRAATWTRSNAA